jgi:hypothetical protein
MVKCRDQWRSLSASFHIRSAEICNHINTGDFADELWIAHLQGVGCGRIRLMADGLSMAANGSDFFGCVPRIRQQGVSGFSKFLADIIVEVGEVLYSGIFESGS